jgi:hypothetical protein
VLWLLSITREEAIEYDAMPRDSCASLSADGSAAAPLIEGSLMVVLRWHDVHRARRIVAGEKLSRMILRLRAEGFTEREVAEVVATPKTTVRRRFDATLSEIVRFLGEAEADEPVPVEASCLVCGAAPRVRLAPVMGKRRGKLRVVSPARTARVCANCLAPDLALAA